MLMSAPSEQTGEPEPTNEEFYCPVCGFGPEPAAKTLVHIVTNHEITD